MPAPEEVIEALRAIPDPEVGINIVDLGLIYGVEVSGRSIVVHYTLTTLACGLGPVIAGQIDEVIGGFGADEARAELTFEPAWTPERISPSAKALLGL
jgi:metal-sulfur cluster biosynthetic enzyme